MDEDARQDEQEFGCHRRCRHRHSRLRVISVSCEVTFGCPFVAAALGHAPEGRLDDWDQDGRPGPAPAPSLPCSFMHPSR